MIAIFDYGSGNLRSALRAFESTGQQVVVTSDIQTLKSAQGLVIPGVGAFSACVTSLLKFKASEIIQYRVAKQLPIFGICVGMQILFSDSQEGAPADKKAGIGIWPNRVVKLSNVIHTSLNTKFSTPYLLIADFRYLQLLRFFKWSFHRVSSSLTVCPTYVLLSVLFVIV